MANPPTGRLDVHTPQTRKEDCTLSYWWVNQGENFERAIKAHTLWTLQDRGGIWSSGRKEIFELRPGDIVIHHARKAIRAVSQVAEAATSARRTPRCLARRHHISGVWNALGGRYAARAIRR